MKNIIFLFGLVFTFLGKSSATTGDEYIDQINAIKDDFRYVYGGIRDIERTQLPSLPLKVSIALQRNSLVLQTKESLDKSKADGNLVDECEELFHSNHHLAIDQLNQGLVNNITRDISSIEEILNYLDLDLDHLQEKIEIWDDSLPEIEDQVMAELDAFVRTMESTKSLLPTLVQHNLKSLENGTTEKLIRETIVVPVTKCLDNGKITEAHL